MKRKLLVLFVSLICVINSVFAVTACGGKNPQTDNQTDQGETGNQGDDGSDGGDSENTEPEHVHDWGEWEVTTPATCTAKGVETRTCKLDTSHKETRETAIDPTAHEFDTDNKCTLCQYELPYTQNLEYRLIEKDQIQIYKMYGVNFVGQAYEVAGMGSATDTDVVIPYYYNNLPVISIGYEAFKDTSITDIAISNNVLAIINNAFQNCTSLENLVIPDSVVFIGTYVFTGCDKIIRLDNGVYYVDKCAIGYDNSVESVTIREDTKMIVGGAFFNFAKLKSLTIPNSVVTVCAAAFERCVGLETVVVGSGVTSIGASAFSCCEKLSNITLPNGLISLGDDAFFDCESLKSITIPDSVTSIGERVFYDSGLESITIPDSVTHIGEEAFHCCSSLTSVTFENATGWEVSESGDMANAEDVTLGTPEENAVLLTDTYEFYYWQRKA